jgi:hypothetical protein
LTYPVRYNEIGYNMTIKEESSEPVEASPQVQTGVEINPE